MTWQESDHPRMPAGALGGRGGEFTEHWALELSQRLRPSRLTNTESGRAELLRRVREDLEGADVSGDSGEERHLTFYHPMDAGPAVVRARYRHWDDENDDGDLDTAEIARMRENEVKSALVAEAIGAPVPVVVIDPLDPRVTLMGYVVGDDATESPNAKRAVMTDEGILLGLFDILVNNNDRGPGGKNWRVTPEGKPVGIDHTQTMEASSERYEPNEYGMLPTGPFARTHFTEPRIDFNGPDTNRMRWIDNPLHPDDIEVLSKIVGRLHATGVVDDRMERHMQLVLRFIGPRARGSRRLIGEVVT